MEQTYLRLHHFYFSRTHTACLRLHTCDLNTAHPSCAIAMCDFMSYGFNDGTKLRLFPTKKGTRKEREETELWK